MNYLSAESTMKTRNKTQKTPELDELDRPIARFQIELLAERMADLERMQRLSGSRTKREICEHAFTVLRTVLEQAARGNRVGFLTPGGEFLEMVYPPLENARGYGKDNSTNNHQVASTAPPAGDLHASARV